MITGGLFYRNAFRAGMGGGSAPVAGTVVKGEVAALYGTVPRSLANPIREALAVYSFDATTGHRIDHSPVTDFAIIDGALARRSGSAIYDFLNYSVVMSGGKYTLTTSPRNPPLTMCLVVYVDYRTDELEPQEIAALAPAPITGRIVTAGDSITGAAHTIGREFGGSDRDGYVGLIRDHFRNVFDVQNFSIDGSTIDMLTAGLPAILATPPAALTVAFGQNDHVAGPSGLDSFKSKLTAIVEDAQSEGVYVVLAGFCRKNPNWIGFNLADALAYNEGIADVAAATGAAFVDVDARWEAMKTVKSQIELTGDNHHHPGNFGSRVYFSAILPHLLSSPISSDDVPDYVRVP